MQELGIQFVVEFELGVVFAVEVGPLVVIVVAEM